MCLDCIWDYHVVKSDFLVPFWSILSNTCLHKHILWVFSFTLFFFFTFLFFFPWEDCPPTSLADDFTYKLFIYLRTLSVSQIECYVLGLMWTRHHEKYLVDFLLTVVDFFFPVIMSLSEKECTRYFAGDLEHENCMIWPLHWFQS